MACTWPNTGFMHSCGVTTDYYDAARSTGLAPVTTTTYSSGLICWGCLYQQNGINAKTSEHRCGKEKEAQVKKGNIMSSIVKRIKNLTVDADTKLLREIGLEDECGDLTDDGEEVLIQLLHAENRKLLVSKAQEIDALDKANKKK